MNAAKRLSQAMQTGSAKPAHLKKITRQETPEKGNLKKYFSKKAHGSKSTNEFGY